MINWSQRYRDGGPSEVRTGPRTTGKRAEVRPGDAVVWEELMTPEEYRAAMAGFERFARAAAEHNANALKRWEAHCRRTGLGVAGPKVAKKASKGAGPNLFQAEGDNG